MKKGLTRTTLLILLLALIVGFLLIALFKGWVGSIGTLGERLFGLG